MSKKHYCKLLVRVLIILPIVFLHIKTFAVSAFPFRAIKQGDSVPNVTLTPMNDEQQEISFSQLKGKPFIVVFWGADLPEKVEHSAKILAGIEGLTSFLDKRNIQRISVNAQNDTQEAVKEVETKSKSTLSTYLDKNQHAYAQLGLFVMPCVLLVNQDGIVVDGMGYSRDMIDRLKGSIEIMLGEKTAEQVAAELRPEMKESTAEEKAVKRHYGYGEVMVKRGQFDAAIREFEKVLEIDPNMKDAHLQLGNLYLASGDIANAETNINKVLEIEPGSIFGQIYKGELLRYKKQYNEANQLLQKVVDAHPDNYKANYYLGRVREDEKKSKEAMDSYKKAYKSIVEYSVREDQ